MRNLRHGSYLQPKEQPRKKRSSSASSAPTFSLKWIVSKLDLRFDEPEVEDLYYDYYAQVKRNLLPTATQVVLLVNILQLLSTCLHLYLLTNNLIPYNRSTQSAIPSSATNSNDNSNNINQSKSSSPSSATPASTASTFNWFLLIPLMMQVVMLIATYMMSKVIKTEINPCRAPDKFGTSTNPVKLSRFKLSLPYILWFIQLIQLASGLWPQQSFISYSTLLLYSYTIYVIFPIRLASCIVLAIGFSLIQLILDHLLLLKLRASSHINEDFSSSSSSSSSNQAASMITMSFTSEQIQENLSDNSLLIPITSQLSKLWAFLILTLGVNIIGIMSFFFYERQQRAAFLETRQSLETKLTLEQESEEQVSSRPLTIALSFHRALHHDDYQLNLTKFRSSRRQKK